MPCTMKPLSCDPARVKGMSDGSSSAITKTITAARLSGSISSMNQLAHFEFANAAGFLINGLKREQLIAMNSMILHELFFDGLSEQSEPRGALHEAISRVWVF